jgi:hypothetical protein
MDAATQQDLFRIARDEMLLSNQRMRRAAIERPGTDTNIMVAGAVAVGDELMGQLISAEASAFLDSARGDKLTRLAFDRYFGTLRAFQGRPFGLIASRRGMRLKAAVRKPDAVMESPTAKAMRLVKIA